MGFEFRKMPTCNKTFAYGCTAISSWGSEPHELLQGKLFEHKLNRGGTHVHAVFLYNQRTVEVHKGTELRYPNQRLHTVYVQFHIVFACHTADKLSL